MSSQAGSTTALEAVGARGFFQHLIGLYTAPSREFLALLRKPGWMLPLLGWIVLSSVFTALWVRNVDAVEFTKAMWEEWGVAEKMPAEARAQALEDAPKAFSRNAWISAVVMPPIIVVVVASLYLFVFRFFFASEVTFKQSLTIVAYTFLVISIVTAPLTLLVLTLQGDWSIDPRVALQANLSLFLDKETAPKVLWSLAESLDLFTFWGLWLLCLGYGLKTSSRSVASAAPGVLAPWGLFVLAKVAFSLLFSG